MASPAIPRVSLISTFDDLMRSYKTLAVGNEKEFKAFCESEHRIFLKLQQSQVNERKLLEKIKSLQSEIKRQETQNKHLKVLVERSVNQVKEIEAEKNALERQITIIKEVLLADGVMDNQTKEKLGFLSSCKASSPTRLETIQESASLLSLSGLTRTDDNIDITSSQIAGQPTEKRSSSESRIAIKRVKLDSLEEDPFTDIIENSFAYRRTRSSSVPSSNSPQKEIFPHAVSKSDSSQIRNTSFDARRSTTSSTPVNRYSTRGKLSRSHIFTIKILYRPEKCHPCRRAIGFMKQALKCGDCRIICHPDCQDQCSLPCVPVVNTTTKRSIGTIADFTSSTSPMIPHIIVHCVNEIESRGLKDIGLYRISGSDREIKMLKEKFLNGHTVPLLHQADVHAICGTVKDFLRSLAEPLITNSAKAEFVRAAELEDMDQSLSAMYDIVGNLPQPNRDTLAFLILHLQRVAESPDCKMPISSLAKMFGPAVVGYSSPEPGDLNILGDTQNQCKIMERLLSISSDLWTGLLNVEPDLLAAGSSMKTPEPTPAPKPTRLGQNKLVYSTNTSKTMIARKPPHISRGSRYHRSEKKMTSSSPLSK